MLEGIASLPSTDENMRAVLQQELEEKGATVLHDELMRQDPRAAANIHPNNHQRLMRALAVIRETGSPLSAQWASHAGGTLYERTATESDGYYVAQGSWCFASAYRRAVRTNAAAGFFG